MRFVLEVDLDELADGEVGAELGRILRYWGGAAKQLDLKPGAQCALYDSTYREVGRWVVTESGGPPP